MQKLPEFFKAQRKIYNKSKFKAVYILTKVCLHLLLQHPVVLMTDKASAEKKSMKIVFPDSTQLLCDFHVGQAEWRWLHEHADSEDRRELMKAFQKVQ